MAKISKKGRAAASSENSITKKTFKKNPFKTEAGIKRTLKAMAKNMTDYGRKFSYNSSIQEAYVFNVKDALGLTDEQFDQVFSADYKTVNTREGKKTIKTYNITPDVLQSELVANTLYREKTPKIVDALDSEGNPIRIEKHSNLRNFYERTQTPKAYEEAVRAQIAKGISITDAKAYKDFDSYMEKNKSLVEGLKGDMKQKKLEELEKAFNIEREKELRNELAKRASDMMSRSYKASSSGQTEVDEVFKTLSEGIEKGILTGDFWDNIVHHDARIVSYEELEFAKAYLEDFDKIEEK